MASNIQFSVTLDDETLAKLDEFRAPLGLSRTDVVRMSLTAMFGDNEAFKASVSELYGAVRKNAARRGAVMGALEVVRG